VWGWTSSGSRKIKELNLITKDFLCVMQKCGGGGGIKALPSRISIIGGMLSNYLGVYTLHPP